MDVKKIKKSLFSDEMFLTILPILKYDNWRKASYTKKLEFFKVMNKAVSRVSDELKDKVASFDFSEMNDEVFEQNIVVAEKGILIDKSILTKKINPYSIIASYFFELFYVDKIEKGEYSKSSKYEKYKVNAAASIFKQWDNLYSRHNPEFNHQPITIDSNKESLSIVYDLLKYMHDNYGMDNYIGGELAGIMLDQFADTKNDKKTEDNYLKMKENYALLEKEEDNWKKVTDFLDDHQEFKDFSDEEFYSLFNDYLICGFDDEFRIEMYAEFVRRNIINDEEKIKEFINNMKIGECEIGSVFMYGDKAVATPLENEFNIFMDKFLSFKIANLLVHEIDDEDFILHANECLEYMNETKDKEDGTITCRYLGEAFSYIELKNKLINYYYDKINNYIKNSKIFSIGYPALRNPKFSKYEAYLKFAFNKSYEEVRKEQFATLKDEYLEKKGAKK